MRVLSLSSRFAFILALVLVLGMTTGKARAQAQIDVRQTISGSTDFVSRPGTEFEVARVLGNCAGEGTFGSYTCNTLTIIPPHDDVPVGFETEN